MSNDQNNEPEMQSERGLGDDLSASAPDSSPERAPVRVRVWRLACLSGLVLALPLLGLWGGFLGAAEWGPELKDAGWWLLPVYLVVAGTLTGLALLPSHLTSLLSGFLFGFIGGLPLALGVVLIGSGLGYLLSRRYAGGDLRMLVDRSKWGRRLATALIDAPNLKAIFVVALVRLPPQVPFALGNVLAASSGVRLLPLVVGTVLGMAPRVGLVVWVGAELSRWELGAPIPSPLLWAVAASAVGFGGLALWSWILLQTPEKAKESI